MELGFPERTALVRRATARLCVQLGWAAIGEVPLPNGRRADLLALRPDGSFACVEVKSGARDFLTDAKWPEYREYSDALYFAVDVDFPDRLVPGEVGLIVADCDGAELLREAPCHPMSPARRRAVLHRFAMLAARRLAGMEDPAGMAMLRTQMRAE